ncbi:MAG: SAM-dependent methyltransferase [archaeon]
MIISVYQAKRLLSCKVGKIDVSLDLGITVSEIFRNGNIFKFPDGQELSLKDIEKIIKKDTVCFLIKENTVVPVSLFSDETNKFYKLYPTASWPSIEISGIRMHVTKAFTPKEDTEKKISFVQPCTGRVLDTCTGLGYTAIMASKTASEVHTFEIDESVIEIEKLNPYSVKLFSNKNIIRKNKDIFSEILKLKSNFFDVVIHDPPRLALASLLYSELFYKEVYRVMKKQARFYHYTGDPGSRNRNQDIRIGITKRMEKCGFRKIIRVFNGLVAEK